MIEPFPLTQCRSMRNDQFAKLDRSCYAMEPKIDGWRIQANVDGQDITLRTRTNHTATGKAPYVERHLRRMGIFATFDGEMVYLDEEGRPDYNFTARCLGSGTEICVDKQRESDKHLTYVIFDVLRLGDIDVRTMPYWKRRNLLEQHAREGEHVKVIPRAEPTINGHLLNLEKYEEGSVLKDLASAYAGRRHKSWLKWKYQPTVDAKIIGYKPGQGKYEGLIGAIYFRSEEGVTGFCSGMDDAARVYISDHRGPLIGKWIEVKHFGKLVEGYRHPQFIRFRPDKG